jgi:hypothetical protein
VFSANPISREENLRLMRDENDWKNSLVMWVFPQEFAASVPRPVQAWFRTFVFCSLVYFGVGLAWVYYIYTCFGDKLFQPGHIPAKRDVFEQIWVSGARRRIPRARRRLPSRPLAPGRGRWRRPGPPAGRRPGARRAPAPGGCLPRQQVLPQLAPPLASSPRRAPRAALSPDCLPAAGVAQGDAPLLDAAHDHRDVCGEGLDHDLLAHRPGGLPLLGLLWLWLLLLLGARLLRLLPASCWRCCCHPRPGQRRRASWRRACQCPALAAGTRACTPPRRWACPCTSPTLCST